MDFEEELERVKERLKPNEVIVYGFGTRDFDVNILKRKARKKAIEDIEFIKNLEGFVGYHQYSPKAIILLFDTLNHAKAGHNLCVARDMYASKILPFGVERSYIKR